MDEDEYIEIEISGGLRERIEAHLASMDRYAIDLIRATAEIEAILSEAVQSKFANQIKLKKVVGDSFGRVVALSYALGSIGQKTYECLLNLQSLRNTVAHSAKHSIKVKESLGLVMFLGAGAEEKVQELAASFASADASESSLALCHKAALQLLIKKVKADVLA